MLVFAQLFNCFNARSETRSAFRGLLVNPWLWGAIALSLAAHVAIVHAGFLNAAFGTVSLSLEQWLCTGRCANPYPFRRAGAAEVVTAKGDAVLPMLRAEVVPPAG